MNAPHIECIDLRRFGIFTSKQVKSIHLLDKYTEYINFRSFGLIKNLYIGEYDIEFDENGLVRKLSFGIKNG